jgi:hypothetical protein
MRAGDLWNAVCSHPRRLYCRPGQSSRMASVNQAPPNKRVEPAGVGLVATSEQPLAGGSRAFR